MKRLLLSLIVIISTQFCALAQVATYVVLAEVYGGGGEQNSYWTNDYIILYNPTSNSVDLSTWSVQYAVFNSSTWTVTNLSGSITANGYYAIQLASDGQGVAPLPFTPNVIGTINLDKNKGKIALTNFQTAISVSNPAGSPGVIDFIGYGQGTNAYEGTGAAPQPPSVTESLRRKDNGGNSTYGTNGNGWDSNDNSLDFYIELDPVTIPPLPVELSSFSAILLKSGIKLVWRTETEVNNYGFEIQKSVDRGQESEWSAIGFVQGYGNSNSPKEYFFIDESVTRGKYSFRLKQIDTDGNYEYSKVIEVNLDSPSKFELAQNYPNPFNPTTTISFVLPQSGNVKLSVYNIIGEQVAELINGYKEAGVYSINFNASDLSVGGQRLNSGVYFYRLSTDNFNEIKKMILMK